MALVLADRVRENTAVVGTGTAVLTGTMAGFQSFAAIGNGNTTYYTITDGTDWEVGLGTYSAGASSLSRDVVLASSAGGTLVNWSAGVKTVFCTYPATRSVANYQSPATGFGLALSATAAATGVSSIAYGSGVSASGFQSVAFGANNGASGNSSAVSGGDSNIATASYSSVGGGAFCNATGNYTRVGGGSTNTASASYATIAGGLNNNATNIYTAIAGGRQNGASGQYAVVGGGSTNIATASYSMILGGLNCTAAGPFSFASGYAASAYAYGQRAFASGNFASVGDAQSSVYTMRGLVNAGSNIYLSLDGGGTFWVPPVTSAQTYEMLIVGRTSSATGGVVVGFKIEGIISREASTVSFGTTSITTFADNGGTVTVGVVVVTNVPVFVVNNSSGQTLRIVATMTTAELVYP